MRPSKVAEGPDTACKVKDNQQVCLATMKSFERSSRGWVIYLEGNQTYKINSTKLPRNQVGKTLEVILESTSEGWTLRDWNTKY